jgi:hypothetical protein
MGVQIRGEYSDIKTRFGTRRTKLLIDASTISISNMYWSTGSSLVLSENDEAEELIL